MWKNLAPQLVRQRIIIEGTTEKIVGPEQIKDYLVQLAGVTNMETLSDPKVYSAHEMGWGGVDPLEIFRSRLLFLSDQTTTIYG